MTGRQVHRAGTLVLSLLMGAIGVALIVQAVSGHGSIVSPRLLLGVLFIAAGAGRLYIEVRRSRGT
jgi:predicted membrane channel-forming protein YqfA (hemolysin III family)